MSRKVTGVRLPVDVESRLKARSDWPAWLRSVISEALDRESGNQSGFELCPNKELASNPQPESVNGISIVELRMQLEYLLKKTREPTVRSELRSLIEKLGANDASQ
jgi:hypothetical protein